MGWTYLIVAGLFEVSWAVSMKYTHGFSRLTPSIITLVGMIASFIFLAKALKYLPLGIAYACWTGIGIVGTFLFSILWLKEPISAAQTVCAVMIVSGLVGRRFFTN